MPPQASTTASSRCDGSPPSALCLERADELGTGGPATRRTSDLRAAMPLGLLVLRGEEPVRPAPLVGPDGTPTADDQPVAAYDPTQPGDIWSLHRFAVEATDVAYDHTPVAIL